MTAPRLLPSAFNFLFVARRRGRSLSERWVDWAEKGFVSGTRFFRQRGGGGGKARARRPGCASAGSRGGVDG